MLFLIIFFLNVISSQPLGETCKIDIHAGRKGKEPQWSEKGVQGPSGVRGSATWGRGAGGSGGTYFFHQDEQLIDSNQYIRYRSQVLTVRGWSYKWKTNGRN